MVLCFLRKMQGGLGGGKWGLLDSSLLFRMLTFCPNSNRTRAPALAGGKHWPAWPPLEVAAVGGCGGGDRQGGKKMLVPGLRFG